MRRFIPEYADRGVDWKILENSARALERLKDTSISVVVRSASAADLVHASAGSVNSRVTSPKISGSIDTLENTWGLESNTC
jgi:hypothetical protein